MDNGIGEQSLEAETGTSSGVQSNIQTMEGNDVIWEQLESTIDGVSSTVAENLGQNAPITLAVEDRTFDRERKLKKLMIPKDCLLLYRSVCTFHRFC